MAITILNPDNISKDVKNVYDTILNDGKTMLETFSNLVFEFQHYWTGTDAYNNIKNMAEDHNALLEILNEVQRYLIEVNNGPVIDFQKDIVNCGGECVIGESLSYVSIADEVPMPNQVNEVHVMEPMLEYADNFDVDKKFELFKANFDEKKEILLKNWVDGAGLENVLISFSNFEKTAVDCIAGLTSLKNRLKVIAENKRSRM